MTDSGDAVHGSLIDTPLGPVWMESDGMSITGLRFGPGKAAPRGIPDVLREAEHQLLQYLAGDRRSFDLPLRPVGTPYQLSVWSAVSAIPWGSTISYQGIADRIGGVTVARAVGNANGANPIPIIIPCHRVIGNDGSLTGYAGGLWRKRWLLQHEGAIGADLFS